MPSVIHIHNQKCLFISWHKHLLYTRQFKALKTQSHIAPLWEHLYFLLPGIFFILGQDSLNLVQETMYDSSLSLQTSSKHPLFPGSHHMMSLWLKWTVQKLVHQFVLPIQLNLKSLMRIRGQKHWLSHSRWHFLNMEFSELPKGNFLFWEQLTLDWNQPHKCQSVQMGKKLQKKILDAIIKLLY